jgi:cell wall-associated NlpC family hydrolase
MTTTAEIVGYARELIGTPYQHQQRLPGLAMDCAAVPVHVGKKLGLSFDDITNYGRQPRPDEMKKALEGNLQRVSLDLMQPGDVVWMRIHTEPQHFGILGDYLYGGLSLIHAYNGMMAVQRVGEHRLDAQWRAKIIGAWRFPGVEQLDLPIPARAKVP